ncbi:MAG TPA: WecB/TagA/CpsF family glycosyltransferase [Puia sp.]|nr:WecB/TagA/CpsF family glycosyltransferase [Puia sp.]
MLQTQHLPRYKHFSLRISVGPYHSFVDNILALAVARESSYVCVANVHMLVEAQLSIEYRKIIKDADIVTPDGMPLTKSLRLLNGVHQERVAGMDLLPDLLAGAQEAQLKVFFYGGQKSMLQKTELFIRKNYPKIQIAGLYSPPFRALSNGEMDEVADLIKRSGAQLVFVVLGCPKQEKWMSEMKGRIPAVMVGVGGALPVLIGDLKRAPRWMQRNSLEWLYRLMQEPKRLFKRYLITNTIYVYLVISTKLHLMLLGNRFWNEAE